MKIGARKYNPLFSALDFDRYPPSIANLPAALTINGQTVYPTLRYKGRDATSTLWRPWGYGETLTLQAGTAPTYNNGSPLLGSVDDSVKFNGGGYYAAGNNTFADVTTEDLVFELVLTPNATGKDPLSKFGETPYHGWYIQVNTTPAFQFSYYHGGSNTVTVLSPAVSLGAVYHVMCFMDRSGSGIVYLNGVAGSAASITAGAASLTKAVPLRLGCGIPALSQYSSDSLFCLSMWQKASWLDTHLQATIAQTRFAQLTGVYPQSARGTYLPTAVTRSSAGYLDKIESDGTSKLYYMGANWPRVCSRKDSLGTVRKGYLSETSVINYCLQSHTFATTWTATRATVPTTSVVCPDGITRTTNTLHEDDSAATSHLVDTGAYNFAITSGVTYTFSCWVKAVNRTWVWFQSYNAYAASAYFDVANGTVGALVSATAGIIPYGNGWYRCYYSATPNVTGNEKVRIYAAEANNDYTYSGLDQDSLYLFGAQWETGVNYPSSYIPTTTTAVTRSADLLRYKMNDGNMSTVRGSLECNILLPSTSILGAPVALMFSDGSTTNRMQLYFPSTDERANFYGAAATVAQWAVQSTSNIWNNGWNKLRGIWGSNDACILVNSISEGTPDTVVTVPTGLIQLDVGAYLSAGFELNGLLSNLKILGLNTTR